MTSATKVRPSVAVIVCAYTLDRIGDLTDCVDALHRQTREADQIVCVIDNNDELVTVMERIAVQHGWSKLAIIENMQTPGLSGARNTGVESTSGEIVLFIDDDAVPADDWLDEIVEPFSDETIAGAGGRIEPGWPSFRPVWFPPHLDWTIGCSIPTLPADGGPIRNMYGASAAFRRTALTAAGGFPTELGRVGANGAGCEETEVCIRIRQDSPSASIVYVPKSTVVHRVSDERATVKYVLRRCLAEGRSKAVLARRVGPAAIGDERGYALVIARTVAADLIGSFRRPSRLSRAVVLTCGLGAASIGYLLERLRQR